MEWHFFMDKNVHIDVLILIIMEDTHGACVPSTVMRPMMGS